VSHENPVFARCATPAPPSRLALLIGFLLFLLVPSPAGLLVVRDVDPGFDIAYRETMRSSLTRREAHVVYGGSELRYAWWTGAAWQYQTVDSAIGCGRYASLALKDGVTPCISYYDSDVGDLKYAQWDGSGWQVEIVDGAGRRQLLLRRPGWRRLAAHWLSQ